MNPVIEAVEEGHYQRSSLPMRNEDYGRLYCRADDERFPCSRILLARVANLDYARALQQQAAIAAGKLSVPSR